MKTENAPVAVQSSTPITELAQIAKACAESGFFADTRQMAQALVKIKAGEEVGIPPIAAMTGIYIVKGKVAFSAVTMAALIKRSGRYTYRVLEHTDTICRIEFFEGGQSLGISSFSLDDAKKAGLAQGQMWQTYPRNMLFARALSNGARWFCPDIFGGPVYTPEELREGEDEVQPAAEVMKTQAPAAPEVGQEFRQRLVAGIHKLWEQRQKLDSSFMSNLRRRNSVMRFMHEHFPEVPLPETDHVGNWLDQWFETAPVEALKGYGKHLKAAIAQEVKEKTDSCAGCGKQIPPEDFRAWVDDKVYCLECSPDQEVDHPDDE